MKISKIIKFLVKNLGYEKISQFCQNIYRTRYATDMYIAQCNVVIETHKKTFEGYKNKHQGQDIVIIATGPSLNKYKPLKNVVNIGVNKAIFFEKAKLDYYFAQDYAAVKSYLTKLEYYSQVTKFYGSLPTEAYGYKENGYYKSAVIPESIIIKHKAYKYYPYLKNPILPVKFNVDIDKNWLVDGASVIFPAIQFALFTNPRKIYLVGCDCSTGYFNETNPIIKLNKQLVKTWKELKNFASIYYPETEIISVNPVGLKGLFTDLYQDEVDKIEK